MEVILCRSRLNENVISAKKYFEDCLSTVESINRRVYCKSKHKHFRVFRQNTAAAGVNCKHYLLPQALEEKLLNIPK